MRIAVLPPDALRLLAPQPIDTEKLWQMVLAAREKQRKRLKKTLQKTVLESTMEALATANAVSEEIIHPIFATDLVNEGSHSQEASFSSVIYKNARIPAGMVNEICHLSGMAEKAFLSGMAAFGLSARAGHSVLRVARTIADVDEENEITERAIEEALEYRQFGDGDAVWPF